MLLLDGTAVQYASWNRFKRLARKGVHSDGSAGGAPPHSRAAAADTSPAMHFACTLHSILSDVRSDLVVFCLDDASAHRKALLPGYKVSPRMRRPTAKPAVVKPWHAMPAERVAMTKVLSFLGLPRVFVKGHEADDVIASYAAAGTAAGHLVRIVGRDKDLLQLVNRDDVLLYDWVRGSFLGHNHCVRKFQVPPHHIPDVLALAGDKADNIRGLRGMGLHTAARLVRQYGGLEALLADVESVQPRARRELLRLHAADLRLFLEVTRLRTDVPLRLPLHVCRRPAELPPLQAVLDVVQQAVSSYKRSQ